MARAWCPCLVHFQTGRKVGVAIRCYRTQMTSGPACANYLVALIDLQGQREELDRWRVGWEADRPEVWAECLKRTYGRVQNVRQTYDWFAERLREQRADLYKCKEYALFPSGFDSDPLTQFSFSDTVVLAARFSTDRAKSGAVVAQLLGCFEMCSALAQTFVLLLSNEIVPRGGIELGACVPIGQNELYGPALHAAHDLESKYAYSPRFVVGPNFVRLLDHCASTKSQGYEVEVSRAIARLVRSWIVPAPPQGPCTHPSLHMLDCVRVSRSLAEQNGDAATVNEMLQRVRAFAARERDRFRREGRDVLAEKYDHLAQLFSQ